MTSRYQLVRKGSMSAPAEALARFWETLREKSRIRIEHPDLPEPLRDAAGEMVGALWQHAQAAAQEALKQLQEESRASVLAAEGSAEEQAWLDVAPVGREFGSPDYERLQILDLYVAGRMTSDDAMWQLGVDRLGTLHQRVLAAGLAVPRTGAMAPIRRPA